MKVSIKYGGRKDTRRWVESEKVDGHFEYFRGCPKNTLVTIEDDGVIYFGISRFSSKKPIWYDDKTYKFTKKAGRSIAEGRAVKEKDIASGELCLVGSGYIYFGDSRLSGCCRIEDLGLVFDYFDDIDKIAPTALTSGDERLMQLAGIGNKKKDSAPCYPGLEDVSGECG